MNIKGLDTDYEVLSALGKIAKKAPDSSMMWSDPHEIRDTLSKFYGLCDDVFERYYDPMLEVFDYIRDNLTAPKDQIDLYFGKLESLDLSIGIIHMYVRYADSLGIEDLRERFSMKIQILCNLIAEDLKKDNFNASGLREFSEAINAEDMDISDKTRLRLMDYLLCIKEYSVKMNAIVEEAITLFNEKKRELERIADKAAEEFGKECDMAGGICNWLKNAGLTINDDDFTLYVSVMNPLIISAEHHAVKDCIHAVHYGVLFDEIRRLMRNSKNGIEFAKKQFKSIGDSTRYNILCALKSGRKCGQELVELTGLTPATISHHMNDLSSYMLVDVSVDGKKTLYSLNEAEILKCICTISEQISHTGLINPLANSNEKDRFKTISELNDKY
ncbi:MAG: metalloregulator ArsR/SmtB family transcription factor [Clostridia bacterium]|nr:metalloregulator ArsR/SmtB family transcription factor [Clostridia bacterium]